MSRRGTLAACALLLVTGLGPLAVAADLMPADALERVKRHLTSPREEERSAALNVLVAIRTPDAARLALQHLAKQASSTGDVKAAGPLLLLLPDDELKALVLDRTFPRRESLTSTLLSKPTPFLVSLVNALSGSGVESEQRLAASLLTACIYQHARDQERRADVELYRPCIEVLFTQTEPYSRERALNVLAGAAWLSEPLANRFAQDPAPGVRMLLAEKLVPIAQGSPEQKTWVVNLLRKMTEAPELHVRDTVSRHLASLDRGTDTIGTARRQEVLEERAVKAKNDLRSKDPYVQRDGLSFFANTRQIKPDQETIRLVEKMAQDGHFETETILGLLRRENHPKLADLCLLATESSAPHTRSVGLRVLAEIKDKRLFQVAARLRQDSNPYVRELAGKVAEETEATMDTGLLSAATVAGLDRKQLNNLLTRFAALEPDDRTRELERLFEKLTPRQRLEFLKPFTSVIRKPLAMEMTEFLIGRLKDTDPAVRNLAIQALPIRVCHMEMLEMLNDPDPMVAALAGSKLGELGLPTLTRHALPVCVKDPSPRGRGIAYEMLRDAYDKEVLLSALKETDVLESHRTRAIACLHLDDLDVCRALLAVCEKPEDLPGGAPVDEKVIASLCQDCQKAPLERKRVYLALIARCSGPAAESYLRQCRSDPDREIRWTVLDALARKGNADEAALDFALSRVLVSDQKFAYSPYRDLIGKPLLERLETFKGLVPADRLDAMRREIQSIVAQQPGRAAP